MRNKVLILVAVLFLVVSSVLFTDAVPVSRSLKTVDVAAQNLLPQGEIKRIHGKLLIEGRIDIETADYSEPGANNDHDPNAPSRV